MDMMKQQRLVSSLVRWLAFEATDEPPGWDALVLEVKPTREAVHMRIQVRGGSGSVAGGVLPERSQQAKDVRALQKAMYTPEGGTWLTALLVATAKGWPEPRISGDAQYNYEGDPGPLHGEDQPMSPDSAKEHLKAFPRRNPAAVPEWMRV